MNEAGKVLRTPQGLTEPPVVLVPKQFGVQEPLIHAVQVPWTRPMDRWWGFQFMEVKIGGISCQRAAKGPPSNPWPIAVLAPTCCFASSPLERRWSARRFRPTFQLLRERAF